MIENNSSKKKKDDEAELSKCKRALMGIRKKFHSQLFTKFAKALNQYGLLNEGDVVAVYVDSSLESLLLALMFRELMRHGKFEFVVKWIVNCQAISGDSKQEILEILSQADITYDLCELPADIKAYCTDAESRQCSRVADLNCYEEVAAIFLSGMINHGKIAGIMPRVKASDTVEIIRPLFHVSREEIIKWSVYSDLDFMKLREISDNDVSESMVLISELKKNNSFAESNIFAAMENVNLNTVTGYSQAGEHYSFTKWYDEYKQELYTVGQDSGQ